MINFKNAIDKNPLTMKNYVFWIFGILQSVSLGLIIFFLFQTLKNISSAESIGLDTQILLSISFPLFLLITEYLIYSKILNRESNAKYLRNNLP
jgi:hypothetical protein